MEYTKNNLTKLSKQTGFIKDNLEKLLRLVDVLKIVYSDNYLKDKLALKGGTAINLAYVSLPRLSIDLDFDFAINYSKSELVEIKPIIKNKVIEILENFEYTLEPDYRSAYALDSLKFAYINNAGNKEFLKIDLNYLDRSHIFNLTEKEVLLNFLGDSFKIFTLNIIELYAAKLNALITRGAPRDLFDIKQMLDNNLITNLDMFKKCLIFYNMTGGKQNVDNISFEKIDKINYFKLKTNLKPLLKKDNNFDVELVKTQVKEFINTLLKDITPSEKEFIEQFKLGNYRPNLLFDNPEILEKIKIHPMAIWRCKSVQGSK